MLPGSAELLMSTWREDGRFRWAPSGAIYPCHTINAARVLSLLGYASDDRLQRTFDLLLATLHDDGGWRCKKFSFGRGPETEFSNPGPTLAALDALRLAGLADSAPAGAVDSLLDLQEQGPDADVAGPERCAADPVAERVHRGLAGLTFCRKGEPTELGTARYN